MNVLRCKKRWFFSFIFLLITPGLIWLADKIWPLPLKDVQMVRLVVARDGSPLWRFADADGIWRYPVELNDVSPHYIEALLAYEDRQFYQHKGVNYLSLSRAAFQNIFNRRIVSGGSTLSMQVARLIEPHNKTILGKLRQIFRTYQLEWYLTKDEILTLYLNRAPFGGTLQGIAAASWVYLGKPPSELSYSEAALMVVLPQAPSRLRPDRHPKRAEVARNKVLSRMAEFGIWDAQLVTDAIEEPIYIAKQHIPQSAPLLARRLVNTNSQIVIKTTIDLPLQQTLEEMAMDWKSQLPPRTSLAILVVDHTDMSVRAYIGSVDFNDNSRFGQVDMIKAWRSPGSTLKPFIYAMAIDDGLIHAESLLQDVPRRFGDYRPGNFNADFNGPVSASEALIRSLNLPAVQLMEIYDPLRFVAALQNTGVTLRFPVASIPNISLILGGTGTRMDQLVSAYSAFARKGRVAGLRFTPDAPLIERPLLSPGAAWIVRRIMAGETRPIEGDFVNDNVPLAWKTGTSYGFRDAWAIGINPRYLIGVWVGRPDATPVAGQFGFAKAVPILNQVNTIVKSYEWALGHSRYTDPLPSSVKKQQICWPSGQPLSNDDANCRQRRYAWILDGMTPPTIMAKGQDPILGGWFTYWQNAQGKRVAPDCPNAVKKQLALWPTALSPWLPEAELLNRRLPDIDEDCPPLMKNISSPLLFVGLKTNSILKRLPGQRNLALNVGAQGGSGKRWWFLNGELVFEDEKQQNFDYTIDQAGHYQLMIMDESGQIAKLYFIVE